MMNITTINERLGARWKDAANLVLGIWLVVSPWVLSYAADATPAWNARVVGVVVAVAALAALIAFHEWEEWINTALAAWLIVSPFLLSFSSVQAALWNQLVLGVLIGLLAIWAGRTSAGGSDLTRSA
jgi:SPW repeat